MVLVLLTSKHRNHRITPDLRQYLYNAEAHTTLVIKYTTTINAISANLNKLLYNYPPRYVHNNEIKMT